MVPLLSADSALRLARELFGDEQATPEESPSLTVVPPSTLCWRLNFLQPHFKEVLIDSVTGDVVLARSNTVHVCTVELTILDTDGLGLEDARGEYYIGSGFDWSHEADASGFMSDANSTQDGNCYCRELYEYPSCTCSGRRSNREY